MWQSLDCCWVGWHTSANGLARVNVQLPIPLYIPSLSWLGHQATHCQGGFIMCTLECVPFCVYSSVSWNYYFWWNLGSFLAAYYFSSCIFYSFSISWSFMTETQGGLLSSTDRCHKGTWESTKLVPKGLWMSSLRTVARAGVINANSNFWGGCYGASGMLSTSFPSHSQVCLAGGLSLRFISTRKIGS